MKFIIDGLIFKDAPARGAFFGITLWLIGTYLLLSLLVLVKLPSPMGTFLAGEAVLTLYCMMLLWRFYFRNAFMPWYSFAIFALCSGCAAFAGGTEAFFGVCMAFWAWFFPLLMLQKVRRCHWLAAGVSWSIGFLLIAFVLQFADLQNAIYLMSRESVDEPLRLNLWQRIADSLQITGNAWLILFAVGLLLCLVGYLFDGMMLADAEGKRLRQLCGPALFTAWAVAVAAHLAFIFMALAATDSADKAVASLEKRFGAPPTADSLRMRHGSGRKPDATFWKQIRALQLECADKLRGYDDFLLQPDVISEDVLAAWRTAFSKIDTPLSRWEQLFEGTIPPADIPFISGRLLSLPLVECSLVRHFSKLERWRVRFAILDGDTEEALAALARINNAGGFLLDNATGIAAAFTWIQIKKYHMQLSLQLLASNLPTESQRHALANLCASNEKQAAILQEHALFDEITFQLDTLKSIGDGYRSEHTTAIPFRTFRFLFPLFWWYAERDKASCAIAFTAPDFASINPNDAFRKLSVSGVFLPAMQAVSSSFKTFTAAARATETLFKADEYRHLHGNFPDKLPCNMPIDPFNNKPMRYNLGTCSVTLYTIARNDKTGWEINTSTQQINAVRAWSVGRNNTDDGGQYEANFIGTDITALLPVNP